jgi:alpha-L-fucosidase
MSAIYSKSSPYANTPVFGNYLDILEHRKIIKHADDVLYKIDSVYKFRPDMLAFDLYGDAGLWWVFAVRNPNVLKDPVFDFYTGVTIYIPKKTNLITELGI